MCHFEQKNIGKIWHDLQEEAKIFLEIELHIPVFHKFFCLLCISFILLLINFDDFSHFLKALALQCVPIWKGLYKIGICTYIFHANLIMWKYWRIQSNSFQKNINIFLKWAFCIKEQHISNTNTMFAVWRNLIKCLKKGRFFVTILPAAFLCPTTTVS